MATGGGPGAMEAANLGAFCEDGRQLEDALERLAAVPSFRPDIAPWASLALQIHDEIMEAGRSRAVSQRRHPDLVLRPRAAQRVLRRHREVLLQRDP